MKRLLLSSVFICWIAPCVFAARFVCYFPNWARYRTGIGQYTVDNIDPSLCTHLMYAFTALDPATYTIAVYDSWADISLLGYSKFVGLKAKNPSLKTMVSIGGWTDSQSSNKYSLLAASSANINTFTTSVVAFLAKYGFDGLDLDWEYPSAADYTGYANLVTALKSAFKPYGYLLSAAVTGDPATLSAGYNLAVISQNMDFINLMAYDYHTSGETSADHVAPLYKRSWETVNNNVNNSVSYLLGKGFPASQINMGIPLYGSSWTLSSGVTAPPAPASGPGAAGPYTAEAGMLAYYEICAKVSASGWQVTQDPQRLTGPYAYSNTSPVQWVGYDDPAMAAIKTNYILSAGLGGAMVWDMSMDDFGNTCVGGVNPVMSAIARTLNNSVSTTTTSKPVSTTTGKTTVASTTSSTTAKTTSATKTTTPTTKPTTTRTTTTTKATSITTAKTSTSTTKTSTPRTTTKPATSTSTKTTAGKTTQTTKSPAPFTCPQPNGLFPDPLSCLDFYTCANGIAFKTYCASGLYFNPTTLVCDWPQNVPSCTSG